jgi:hypothetical protein
LDFDAASYKTAALQINPRFCRANTEPLILFFMAAKLKAFG